MNFGIQGAVLFRDKRIRFVQYKETMVFTKISMIPRKGYQNRYTRRPIDIFWLAQDWIKIIQQENKPGTESPTECTANAGDEGTIRSSGFAWKICRLHDAKLLTLLFFLKI